MKKIIIPLLRKLWLISAILLICLALLFSIVRALTPWVSEHKEQIAHWVSQQLQMPVAINQVKATWYGLSPVIELDGIDILTTEKQQPIFQIHKLYVGIDILKSFKNWRFELGKLTISGIEVILQQQVKGNWTVKGFEKLTTAKAQASPVQFVWNELIKQSQITLHNINLHLIPKQGREINIKQLNLLWQSNGKFHRLTGQTIAQNKQSTQVRFLVQIIGDNIKRDQLQATFYIQIEDLPLLPWVNNSEWQGLKLNSGVADFDITGRIDKGRVYMLQTHFDIKNAAIQTLDRKTVAMIDYGRGQVRWNRINKKQWELIADNVEWKIDDEEIPTQSFNLHYQHDELNHHVALHGKAVSIPIINTILTKSKILTKNQKKILKNLQPSGYLKDLIMQFNYNDNHVNDFQIESSFENLSFNKWQKFLGVKQLSGYIKFDKEHGQLLLDSTGGSVDLKPLFREALPFDSLKAQVDWSKQDNHWQVKLPKVYYAVNDILLEAEAAVTESDAKLPLVDSVMTVKANNLKQKQISRYFPATLIPHLVLEWLDQAFVSAEHVDVKAVLRGPLSQFPFDKDQGTFIVEGIFDDLTLNYQKSWPMAASASGKLHWRGRSLNVALDTVTLDQLHLSSVTASLPYIGVDEGVILHLKGKTKTDVAKPLNYIKKTPLVYLLDDKISQLSGSGDIDLALELAIPINDNQMPTAGYNGKISFDGTELQLTKPEILVENLHGSVDFSEKTLISKDLTAELFSNPATINMTMQSNYPIIQINGKADISGVEKMLSIPSNNFLSGSANFDLSIAPNANGVQVTVKSDLTGINSQLPAPLTKVKKQGMPSLANIFFDKDHNIKLQFQLANYINGALEYVSNNQQLTAGQIQFGDEPADFQAMPGLVINGKTQEIDWDKWQEVFKLFSQDKRSLNNHHLRDVHITVPTFNIFGQVISNADLSLRFINDNWEIKIQSNEISGIINIPNDYQNKVVMVNLDRLYLRKGLSKDTKKTNFNFKNLPSINANIKDFKYQDKQLGKVVVNLQRNEKGMAITNLTIQSQAFTLQAGGFFATQDGLSTALKGTITSNDTKKTLKQWGIPDHIESREAQIGFDLTWQGSIVDFAIPYTKGYISIRVDKGRITGLSRNTDAKLGLGRLISVLSLQSLPKRLQLNFKDLTSKGYFFDKMRGDFVLDNGIATTHNAYLQGQVAQVDLLGSMNMREQTYDLVLKVLPNITSSLPVVATIAGGPVAGIATWAADKLVGKQVNKITRHTYYISGPWSNPAIATAKQRAHNGKR